MRLFLGLYSPDLTKQALDDSCIEHQVMLAHLAQDRHMTLCFLGDYSNTQQTSLVLAINAEMNRFNCNGVDWHGELIGDFPRGRPTAWAWQGPITDSLKRLLQSLSKVNGLSDIIQLDGFLPHVTLAYIKGGGYPDCLLPSDVHFTQLILYCSLSQVERDSITSGLPWAKPRYKKLNVWEI